AGAGTLNLHLDLADAELLSLLRRALGRLLGRERGGLARAFIADRAGGRPAERVAARIGDRDDRVVEGGLDMADRLGHQLLDLAHGAGGGGGLLLVRLGGLGGLRCVFLFFGHVLFLLRFKWGTSPASCPRPSSAAPSGSGRSSASAARARAARGGDGCRGSTRCPSGAGCSGR